MEKGNEYVSRIKKCDCEVHAPQLTWKTEDHIMCKCIQSPKSILLWIWTVLEFTDIGFHGDNISADTGPTGPTIPEIAGLKMRLKYHWSDGGLW